MCIILRMGSANESRRYNVTSSLTGWAHTQNDRCKSTLVKTEGLLCIKRGCCLMTIWWRVTGSLSGDFELPLHTLYAALDYSRQTMPMSLLLMSWLLVLRSHQQSRNCLCRMGRSLPFTGKNFNYQSHFSVKKWHKTYPIHQGLKIHTSIQNGR